MQTSWAGNKILDPSNGIMSGMAGSSPMLNLESPAAMGLSLGDLDGGMGMGTSMSNPGVGVVGRSDDEEKRRRLEEVLEILAQRPGRVSEEGVERLARRCGLEVSWSMTADERKLGIAGLTTFLVDVYFRHNAVERVDVEFAAESEEVTAHAKDAAEILQKHLSPSPGSRGGYTTLQKFALNLEQLAVMDKLSSPSLNCFDAVAGLYVALTRLFDCEKTITLASLAQNLGDRDLRAQRIVTCKKGGHAAMHTGSTVGLALAYWMNHHDIVTQSAQPSHFARSAMDRNSMDIDAPETTEDGGSFCLMIECESCPCELYPPIRISNSWVTTHSDLQLEEGISETYYTSKEQMPGSTVQWLDPPPTYITLSPTVTAVGGSVPPRKLPDVRFVAKLEPPLVLPLHVAEQICNSVGMSTRPDKLRPTTFNELILHGASKTRTGSGLNLMFDGRKTLTTRKSVKVRGSSGEMVDVAHLNSLFVSKAEYARELFEVPFEHPKQIVAILPLLRQYAFLSRLIRSSFAAEERIELSPSPKAGARIRHQQSSDYTNTIRFDQQPRLRPKDKSMKPLLDKPPLDEAIPIDLSLSIVPSPRLAITFPLKKSTVAKITLAVLPNAEIIILSQNLISVSNSPASSAATAADMKWHGETAQHNNAEANPDRQRLDALAKGLLVCEDLGVWAEWIRRKFG